MIYTIHDIGGRDEQQDRFAVHYVDGRPKAFVVVDGMGGHDRGAEAADIALDAFLAALSRVSVTDYGLRTALTSAAAAVCDMVPGSGFGAPGACLTALVIDGDRRMLAHVGDTMLWAYQGESWWRRSAHHADPASGILILSLGGGSSPAEVEHRGQVADAGHADAYLLATDGLVHSERVRRGWGRSWMAVDPPCGDCDEGTLGRLLARSREAGEDDNATGILWIPKGAL